MRLPFVTRGDAATFQGWSFGYWSLAYLLLVCFSGDVCLAANALDISNRLSPRNPLRAKRPHTQYIVLHTTEGAESGSLRKIRRRGEAHYFVTKKGRVYRIIEKSRIATHAGRSMWAGKHVLDNYSIGIEVVGYHNRDLTGDQNRTLRELIRQLQALYKIPDENVVTHSMVAYGRPNRFQPNNHRGRKRCGMILAKAKARLRLGLEVVPWVDQDVKAGRLSIGDPELHTFLYTDRPSTSGVPTVSHSDTAVAENVIRKGRTAWDIARERFRHPNTLYVFPNGKELKGTQVFDWDRIPVGTRVEFDKGPDSEERFEGFLEIGKDGSTAQELAGEAFAASSTIYFFPNGLIRTGEELSRRYPKLLANLPEKTQVLTGYIYGGYVKSRRLPEQIAGRKWNYPSTFYRLPNGKIVNGDGIKATAIPKRTLVFYQS